jgi:mono/diheme cytochrome c family protein
MDSVQPENSQLDYISRKVIQLTILGLNIVNFPYPFAPSFWLQGPAIAKMPEPFWRCAMIRRAIFVVIVILIVLVPLAITFTVGWRPFIGPRVRQLTDRKFEVTPARMERGKYLVNGIVGCVDCHSEHDPTLEGAPPKAGREGAGVLFLQDANLGKVYASNITPDKETGIGNWTDDQIARAIREGIGSDGRALFPIMPYRNFRNLSDEDLAAVVVYMRSIPPVRNAVPKTAINFPVNRLIMTVPEPISEPVHDPDMSTPLARGKHLVTLASCADCHTPQDSHGQAMENLPFAGGFLFDGIGGKKVAAANITSDPTGIPYYDEATFIKTIRTGQIGARKIDPVMPWGGYRNMTDNDLQAVFAFVRTLKPVRHAVDNSVEPTLCPLCGYKHGLGEKNHR